ncbi:colanic acid biosynthesis acetyltransferase WcaF [Phormidium tenue FACHB-886]|nr:colanic acid biosynthesis acetyltransferase WcaF [Phormidium tenue FACHB-886]
MVSFTHCSVSNEGISIDQNSFSVNPQADSLVDLRCYNQSKFDRGRSTSVILLWWLVQAIVFPLTPHFMNAVRAALLRLFGARIGRGVVIRPTARFTYPWKVTIGDYSWIGDDVVMYSLDRITIGDHCVISQKSYVCTGSHSIHDPAFGLKTAAVVIGNGAWVASNCFIAPGTQIGANAVIGACSAVFRDMPNQHVCWGNPCCPRRLREMH